MMPSPDNLAIIAAAGSRKTEHIVDSALAVKDEPVLITTYTLENQRQILNRIHDKVGPMPSNLTVLGWFSFLIAQGARPYQRALTGSPGTIKGLNFKGRRSRYVGRDNTDRFYFDAGWDMYRDGVSDFVVHLNEVTEGAVINRLERIYRHVFIDEVQDLVGWDLELLDLLFASSMSVTIVGDPRQHTLSTNLGPKNRQYRGAGFLDWLEQRHDICTLERRNENYRSNQAICDFADKIYPEMSPTVSRQSQKTGHDGVFFIREDEAIAYFEEHRPVVLRDSKVFECLGLPARNIGVAKGSTFDRVLLFPTRPILRYLKDGDSSKLKAPERLYVAVTRARYSVAIVIPA